MTVYLASALHDQYPHIATIITGMLSLKDVECKKIKSSNKWIRDVMPIKTNSHYTKFVYKTVGYDKYPQLHVDSSIWHPFCDAESPLILDGGNVEKCSNVVLISEIIFKHNPHIEYRKLVKSIETTFDREVVFLPVEPGDTLGHMDGIARFIDDKTVLVNNFINMGGVYEDYQKQVIERLRLNGFDTVLLPNANYAKPKMTEIQFREKYPLADDWNDGYGYYVNFYRSSGLLFMPCFNIPEDAIAYKVFKQCFPNDEIVPVNCSDLSMEGGLLNCCTWEYEKPGRII